MKKWQRYSLFGVIGTSLLLIVAVLYSMGSSFELLPEPDWDQNPNHKATTPH